MWPSLHAVIRAVKPSCAVSKNDQVQNYSTQMELTRRRSFTYTPYESTKWTTSAWPFSAASISASLHRSYKFLSVSFTLKMLMFFSLGARDVDSIPQSVSSYLRVVYECIIVRGSFEFFFDNPEVSCHTGIQKPCSHGEIRVQAGRPGQKCCGMTIWRSSLLHSRSSSLTAWTLGTNLTSHETLSAYSYDNF